jgi:hypothetical protein
VYGRSFWPAAFAVAAAAAAAAAGAVAPALVDPMCPAVVAAFLRSFILKTHRSRAVLW